MCSIFGKSRSQEPRRFNESLGAACRHYPDARNQATHARLTRLALEALADEEGFRKLLRSLKYPPDDALEALHVWRWGKAVLIGRAGVK